MTQGLKPRMTYAQYLEAIRCHEIHTQTPQLTDLARAWGIPKGTVISSVKRRIKRYDKRMHHESLGKQESADAREANGHE